MLVASSGILSTSWSRYATRTWPGECRGANMDRSGKRRPKSGCVGSVTSISWAGSLSGFLTGVLRCVLVRHHRPRQADATREKTNQGQEAIGPDLELPTCGNYGARKLPSLPPRNTTRRDCLSPYKVANFFFLPL